MEETTNVYQITAENRTTGDSDIVWNQQADSEAEALEASDLHFRQLGWPAGWVSTHATLVGTAPRPEAK